jgi:hypothetical protein
VNCAEFKERVEAYALGALEPAEATACAAHLEAREHDGCIAALRRAQEAVALVGAALPPVKPEPATWAAIVARTGGATVMPARRRVSAVAWALAAAAALLLVWLLRDRAVLQRELRVQMDRAQSQGSQRAQCVADLERARGDAKMQREALALLAQPGAKVVTLAPSGGAATSANVILRAGDQHAFLVGRNLAPPVGRDYELWLIRGTRKIPAGLLRGDATGTLVTALDPALLREGLPDALAVTLESAGGHAQPEGPIVAVGAVGKI